MTPFAEQRATHCFFQETEDLFSSSNKAFFLKLSKEPPPNVSCHKFQPPSFKLKPSFKRAKEKSQASKKDLFNLSTYFIALSVHLSLFFFLLGILSPLGNTQKYYRFFSFFSNSVPAASQNCSK